ncbi:transposase [Campylobacter sp. RM16187]|uniref:transposase n=1 Tax=Campylobacter sp. RM16187 TaxID=1660063 RepID=UPI0021B55FFF|nr:transposase [Campylobacter sp. RM16187]QKG28780.1 IS110 family transposase [Campylobacter sp. RM16187]
MKKDFFVGADVSKDKVDFCFLTSDESKKPKFISLPNDYNVIEAYFKSFTSDNITVVLEYTNNYHIILQRVLNDLGIKYSLLNPEKTSYFLKHLNSKKTDIADSYGLALYCRIFSSELNPTTYNKEYNLIKSYNSAISLLVKIQTQLKNFKKSQNLVSDNQLNEIITTLTNQVMQLQKKLKLMAYEILKSFVPNCDEIIKANKGFGVDLAISLFPNLHFNRDKTAKQFISFLGLSPRIYESGISVKKSKCINKKGSSSIRRVLFLVAIVSIRFNDKFKQKYETLINKGKSKKVAIVAVMCAIVRYLKSLFPFDECFINGKSINKLGAN